MKTGYFLLLSAMSLVAMPGNAAVTVLGSSAARLCYEAAEAKALPGRPDFEHCDEALLDKTIMPHDRVATYVNRGILKLRTGRSDEAIGDFDTALAEDPDQAEAYLNKAIALVRTEKDYGQATALFSTALEKRTKRPALAYYGRGLAHELTGRVRQAYLDYREAARLEPHWREPRTELARFTVRRP